MPPSSKPKIAISLGASKQERDRLAEALRLVAVSAGFSGRYGGDLSKLIDAIARLPEEKRQMLGVVIRGLISLETEKHSDPD